jgi:hypothetical protein
MSYDELATPPVILHPLRCALGAEAGMAHRSASLPVTDAVTVRPEERSAA